MSTVTTTKDFQTTSTKLFGWQVI